MVLVKKCEIYELGSKDEQEGALKPLVVSLLSRFSSIEELGLIFFVLVRLQGGF